MKVFLNPGHAPDGNPDPGACGCGLRECDVAKSVADLVEHYLVAAGVEVVGNLHAELARRTQNDGLCCTVLCIDLLQQRQSEGCRFARTCLCKCDDIILIAQQIRDYFFLNRHRMFETQLFNGAANRFADAQFFKCFQFFLIKCEGTNALPAI